MSKIVAHKEKKIEYIKSKEKYGWIYFIKTKCNNGSELNWWDLRKEQSSLSLRSHVQQGISATRKDTNWDLTNRCLNDFVVATIKFPNEDDWNLIVPLFGTKYMFPSSKFDSTYRYLKGKRFKTLLNSIEKEYQFEKDELGEVNDYIND